MRSVIRRWILSRVVRSALSFESEAIEQYRGLLQRLADGPVRRGLEHLLAEEEMHGKILKDAAEGRLDPSELESALRGHLTASLPVIEPLDEAARRLWGGELEKALAQEQKTFIFYSNLRRMSKIPVVKKAFEVLSDMEREHAEILSKLLGR